MDFEALGVEDDLARALGCLNVEGRRAADPPGVEIGDQVERDMGDPGDFRPRIAVNILRILGEEDRRHHPLGRSRLGGLALLFGRAGGEEQQSGGKGRSGGTRKGEMGHGC